MAGDGQVCCCGTNRGWLLFMAGLNIFSCVLGIFLSAVGLVALSKVDKSGLTPEEQGAAQVGTIFLAVLLVACAIVFLINLLPIIAEMKKKPKLHMAFRNWTIICLVFQVIGLAVRIAGLGPKLGGAEGAEGGIANGVVSLLLTIFTLVLVSRRMRELQAEIGQTSFFKFV